MIKAAITDTGVITLAIYGDEIEKVKLLPTTLSLSDSGTSKNFKTGRQCRVIRLDSTDDVSDEVENLTKKLTKEKRATIKAKSDLSKALNTIKALEKKLDAAVDADFEEDK